MPLGDVRSVHLPYCIQRQSDGTYVVLNREYRGLEWGQVLQCNTWCSSSCVLCDCKT
jgi:hypothetical protein